MVKSSPKTAPILLLEKPKPIPSNKNITTPKKRTTILMNTIVTSTDGTINIAFENDPEYKEKEYDLVQATNNKLCPQLGIQASTDSHWLCEHATMAVMTEDEWEDFQDIRIGIKLSTGENVEVNPNYTEDGFDDEYEYAESLIGMGTENILTYPLFEESNHPGTLLADNFDEYNVWVVIGD